MNAVVTGATKGIGRAIVDSLAAAGYNLAINARTSADLEALLKQLSSAYPTQHFVAKETDMGEKSDVIEFASFVLENFDTVDVLVNNAGIFIPAAMNGEEDAVFEKIMAINVFSAYYLTKRLIPIMKKNGAGHIFNMCSIASIIAYPSGGAYATSKFALLGMSKSFREEMKPHNIKVTSILPGATWSNSWAGVDIPEERFMPADDVAKAVMTALEMSERSVLEEIIIRPQLGDL